MSKIVIGMSGGVDSSIAAKILKDQGHEVLGVFMRNWDSFANNDVIGKNKKNKTCQAEQDWEDAKKISEQLNIKIVRVNFVKEYWENVFSSLIKQYKNGQTPNPDILCNRHIKFGLFYDWVYKNYPDVDFIATGHYAKIEKGMLKIPKDTQKDQTYFLAQIDKHRLKKTLFPLSNLLKSEVRKMALKNNLIVANKKDSVGICFIGKRRHFSKFLQNYIPVQPGKIINIQNNEVIGQHIGAMYYTIGQRKGLNLGGHSDPFYVVGHNLKKRFIFVTNKKTDSYLISNRAIITNVNWFGHKKENLERIKVKFRYRSNPILCSINWINQKDVEIKYPKGFKAVTPGQHAVFYQGNYCLGGGFIDKVFDNKGLKRYL